MNFLKYFALSLALVCAVLLAVSPAVGHTQEEMSGESYAFAPGEVDTIGGIIKELYAVISGPAGPRDWERFSALFVPGALMVPSGIRADGEMQFNVSNPKSYIENSGAYFMDNAFYELEIARTTERYANIAHVFTTYAAKRDPGDMEPFMRGINSVQMVRDEGRWWIVSIMWFREHEDYPLPEEYLP